jgi:3-deoxy-D-manno-octulosonate 8-phosphate phosphatase (KDO 8-P phosphatase)
MAFSELKLIRLFVTDVDGTLTDGGMYYSSSGEMMKKFHTRDAAGMARLRQCGIELAIVTTEDSDIVLARANKMKVAHVYLGAEDKERVVADLLAKLGLTWDQLAFVGDDLNDLEVIHKAGFSACPADAVPAVRQIAGYVCSNPGGAGAVREVCDLILTACDERDSET